MNTVRRLPASPDPAANAPHRDRPESRAGGSGEADGERKRRDRAKQRVEQEVEQAIRADADPRDVESLLASLREWLDDEAFDVEFGRRSIDDLFAFLCDELSLSLDWTRPSDADWRLDAGGVGAQAPLSAPPRPIEPQSRSAGARISLASPLRRIWGWLRRKKILP